MADRMTMRVVNQDWQPLRCVITRGGTLTGDESLFQTEGGDIHLLSEEIPALLHRQDVHWHRGSLGDFLTRLHADFGVNHLHCEGGGNLMQEIIRLQPPDVIHLTWAAHTLFGGEKSPTITGVPASAISLENGERSWGLSASLRYQLREANPSKCGREMFLSYALADQNLPRAQ
jgi:riboflavin biosynthesis pyrimidine reductase